jgi:hypothetical protein
MESTPASSDTWIRTITFVADIPDWPEADLMELMKRIEKEIPQKDSLRFDSRADKLNWDNVRQHLFLNMLRIWVQGFYELGVRRTRLGVPARIWDFCFPINPCLFGKDGRLYKLVLCILSVCPLENKPQLPPPLFSLKNSLGSAHNQRWKYPYHYKHPVNPFEWCKLCTENISLLASVSCGVYEMDRGLKWRQTQKTFNDP